MTFKTDTLKNQQQLEQEIAQQRAHLTQTIQSLEQKFSLHDIVDQVLNYGKENGGAFGNNLVGTIKNNPIPTLITAIGLSWMMYSQNRSSLSSPSQRHPVQGDFFGEQSNASYGVDPEYDSSLSHRAFPHHSDLKNKIDEKAHQVKHSVEQAGEKIKEKAHHLKEDAHHLTNNIASGASKLQHDARHLFHEQPITFGLLGLAVGALIGASLPSTRQEDEWFGQSSDESLSKLRHNATDKAHEIAQSLQSSFQDSNNDSDSLLNKPRASQEKDNAKQDDLSEDLNSNFFKSDASIHHPYYETPPKGRDEPPIYHS